jgi:regulator of ribonuclease activity B
MKTRSLESVIAGHVARNQELCKLIESKGADLADERLIDLHFWADGEIAAHRLADALRGRGWSRVSVDPPEDDGDWNVETQITASVLKIVDLNFTKDLAQLATHNQSVFDGWGTEV